MLKLYVWLRDLFRGENGQDMVEYALIIVLIAIAIILATVLILDPAFKIWADGVAACISSPDDANCVF